MREIVFFVEDTGHETVLSAFVQRFAFQYKVQVEIVNRSATGGHGRVISELRKYLHELEHGKETVPDLLIIATDGNCIRIYGAHSGGDRGYKKISRINCLCHS